MLVVEGHTDDVLIQSATEEHDKTLRLVLNTLQDADIMFNKEKCIFGINKVEFLRHEISGKC